MAMGVEEGKDLSCSVLMNASIIENTRSIMTVWVKWQCIFEFTESVTQEQHFPKSNVEGFRDDSTKKTHYVCKFTAHTPIRICW